MTMIIMNDGVPKDQMTPFERMMAFSKGEPIDRVPCCPFTGESYAPYFGHTIASYNHDKNVIVDTITRTFELFKADNCSIGPGLHGLPEAMGCKLDFPVNNTPTVVQAAIEDYSLIDREKIIDPYRSGRLANYLEAIKEVQARVKGQVCVGNTISGPFTTASFLIGTAKLMRDFGKRPEEIHELLEWATDNVIAFMDAVMDLGITPGIADPIASCSMVSPKIYHQFVLPYTKRCQDHIRTRMGDGGAMHICGKTSDIWEDMIKTGISALSLDNCDDIGRLSTLHGTRVTVVGNVDPVGTIMNGTRDEIHEAVRVCIEKAGKSPKGFILASGCDIPIGTPPEKVHFFLEGARIYGRM